MSPEEKHRAELGLEARRLKENAALEAAFDRARQEALEALATADAADVGAMVRLQARVAAIDAIRTEIERMILMIPKDKRAVI